MKITLELYDDQSCYDEDELGSSMWVLKLNGHELTNNSLVSLKTAHLVTGKLMDIEELINNAPN